MRIRYHYATGRSETTVARVSSALSAVSLNSVYQYKTVQREFLDARERCSIADN